MNVIEKYACNVNFINNLIKCSLRELFKNDLTLGRFNSFLLETYSFY